MWFKIKCSKDCIITKCKESKEHWDWIGGLEEFEYKEYKCRSLGELFTLEKERRYNSERCGWINIEITKRSENNLMILLGYMNEINYE